MPLDIIQQEIYTGSINFRAHSCDCPLSLSLSLSAPYLATPHLSLHSIGSKHIPSYFALGIGNLITYESKDVRGAMGCDQKKLYTSVEVTPAPVLVPTQRPLAPSIISILG